VAPEVKVYAEPEYNEALYLLTR